MRIHAAGWLNTGNPPDTKAASRIELSADGGETWVPVVTDWRIVRRDPEPAEVTFAWTDQDGATKIAAHTYPATAGKEDATWSIRTGSGTTMRWVEVRAK